MHCYSTIRFGLILFSILLQSCIFDKVSEPDAQQSSKVESAPTGTSPDKLPVADEPENLTTNPIATDSCVEGLVLLSDPTLASPEIPLCGSLPAITQFNVPSKIYAGSKVTLQFAVSGTVQSVFLNPGQIDLLNQNTVILRPTQSTSYTLYVTNNYGTVSKTVQVNTEEVIPVEAVVNDSCSASNDLITFKNTKKSSDFGIIANSDVDQTDLIQTALDSLKSGERLLFSPGIYLHSRSLKITKPNVVIEGDGADLRGTNSDDQAIVIQADNVVLRNFTITNYTLDRKKTPWSGGISIYGLNSGQKVMNTKIMNNILTSVDGLGYRYQNGSGIYVYNADNYLISGNLISRSNTEGIHSTARSRNGRIIYNTVLQSGDDGITVVSALDKDWRSKTNIDVNFLKNNYESVVSSNILIHKNIVSGNYWGRGISVVGGKNISITKNNISKIFGFAGLLISRESSIDSAGANNVLVKNNNITEIATSVPEFVPQGTLYKDKIDLIAAGPLSGQGAVEIRSIMTSSDYLYPGAPDALSVQNIHIEKTTVTQSLWDGVRVGMFSTHLRGLNFVDNIIINSGLNYQPMLFKSDVFDKMPYCSNNRANNSDYESAICSAINTKSSVSGFMCYLP